MKVLTRNSRRPSYEVRRNLYFKNKVNDNSYTGDLVNEEDIEGKRFYIVKVNNRTLKLAKEFYTIVKR
jgi:putative ribosome biogenesis GTPase RsgA